MSASAGTGAAQASPAKRRAPSLQVQLLLQPVQNRIMDFPRPPQPRQSEPTLRGELAKD
jgi:hypothetical protein